MQEDSDKNLMGSQAFFFSAKDHIAVKSQLRPALPCPAHLHPDHAFRSDQEATLHNTAFQCQKVCTIYRDKCTSSHDIHRRTVYT